MKTFLSRGALFVLGSLVTTASFGWGDIGHATTGYIAEKLLKEENSVESRRAQRLIYEVLGGEPLAHAATWPDAMRSDVRYDPFKLYHFVTMNADRWADMTPEARNKASANSMLTKGLEGIRNRKLSVHQRAIFLRYFVHLVGDVHQPLHVGNPYDTGANDCKIYTSESARERKQSTNLHSFWDTGIFDGVQRKIIADADRRAKEEHNDRLKIGYFTYVNMGDALVDEFRANPDQWADLQRRGANADRAAWYDETHALHAIAYPDGPTPLEPTQRAYCEMKDPVTRAKLPGFDPTKIPLIDDAYLARAVPVAKAQVVLGGIRLATELKKLAVKMKMRPMTEEDVKDFFKPLLVDQNAKPRTPASDDSTPECEGH